MGISLHLCVDIYRFDPDYLKNEEIYNEIKSEILGADDEDEEGDAANDDDADDQSQADAATTDGIAFIVSTFNVCRV